MSADYIQKVLRLLGQISFEVISGTTKLGYYSKEILQGYSIANHANSKLMMARLHLIAPEYASDKCLQ